jgi:aldehyde dehydrogenase (NAD+)
MSLSDLLLSILGPASDPTVSPAISTLGERRLLINGHLVEARSGATFDNVDPTSEVVLGSVCDAGVEDAREAIQAARKSFDSGVWDSPEFRRTCLVQLQDALRRNAAEYRESLIAEIGCPRRMTFADQYDYAVDKLGFYSDLLGSYEWSMTHPADHLPGAIVSKSSRRMPVGVVAAITPWNLPVELILAKVGGALAAGCTMIIKPSPLAPWAGTILGRLIAEETDIPAGVVNVIASSQVTVGVELTSNPQVDAIAFTGSTATGRSVMAAAAQGLKRVSLELGGKSAAIILDDFNVEEFLPVVAGMACFNSGQSCIMPSRMLVPASLLDQSLTAAVAGMKAVTVGDPRSFDTFMGPLISQDQRSRVEGMIHDAVSTGAELVAGGGRPSDLDHGFFLEPTLLTGLPEDASILRDEVFGPVVCVIPYSDIDEAVHIANSSEFGLAGYVWSGSTERAMSVGRRLQAGMIGINGGMFTAGDMPFGGVKSSGMGREWGVAGMEEFLDIQTMAVRNPA